MQDVALVVLPREYSSPTEHGLPTGTVADSEGSAQYTASGDNRIGRLCLLLDTSGTYLTLVHGRNTPDHGR